MSLSVKRLSMMIAAPAAPAFTTAIVATVLTTAAPLATTARGEEIRIESAVVTPVDQVDLPSRAVGQIVEIAVNDGAAVRKGDTIARVDTTEAEMAVEKARGALAIAKAEAANRHRVEASAKGAAVAKAELQRAVEAGEKYAKSISQTELDRLRLAAEQLQLEHAEARHDLEVAVLNAELKKVEVDMAERMLERHRLVSPINGIVVELRRRLGEWVEPGMPVARIISTDPLRVEGFLDGRRLSRVQVGLPVRFTPAGDDAKPVHYVGKLSFISPEANPVNGQIRIAAMFENPERRLLPGLHGELVIRVSEANEPETSETKPARDEKEADDMSPSVKAARATQPE
jgi:macrolide-specific efflux system membrane fusion protein